MLNRKNILILLSCMLPVYTLIALDQFEVFSECALPDDNLDEDTQLDTDKSRKSKSFCNLCTQFLTVGQALNVNGPVIITMPTRRTPLAALMVNGNEIVNGNETVNGTLNVNGELLVNGIELSSGTVTSVSGGTGITVTGGQTSNPTVNLTVPVSITNGGTGATALTAHGVLIGETSAISATTAGTAGQLLQSGGSSLDPSWTTSTYPSTNAQGDLIYGSAVDGFSTLAKNTTATRYLANTGTNNNPNWSQITLTNGVTGTLPIANGGTNASSMVNTYGVVYYDGTLLNTTLVGSSGQLLTSNGTTAPTFQSFTITGDSGSVSGQSLTLSATSGSGNTVKFSGSGTTVMSLSVSDGNSNTAVGAGAGTTSMGSANTVFGQGAAPRVSAVTGNCAFGQAALLLLTGGTDFEGSFNCAFGQNTLSAITTGASNIAIGQLAGVNLTSNESNNIYLASVGVEGESSVLRINSDLAAAYIGGITGVSLTGTPAAVYVSDEGQLGILVSSRKYKDNIVDIDPLIVSKVIQLRPVSFTYKKSTLPDDIHYGLIAEEVIKVIPNMVICDKNKEPYTVKYHELPVLLLAHIQLLYAEIEALKNQMATVCAR